ncbi:MAG: sll0787 family AIR synthase-like protein [Candidatus Neomarinimicrobiota bacterium]|nr:sll0787 family AIR synthase-like protein [Candidatus Neomarinimicrobiota bacterium]
MPKVTLKKVVKQLCESEAWQHKCEISTLSAVALQQLPVIDGHTVRLGDDTAAIETGEGYLLLATEAVHPPLIEDNPYLAGRAAILANVNDIYAMGGMPSAVVNTIIAPDTDTATDIMRGLKDGCNRYDIAIVGGHTTATGHSPAVTVSIVGRAEHILSSFTARPDDVLLHVTNLRGSLHPKFPFWDCSSHLSDADLRRDLSILPMIAKNGWCDAARDISMAGMLGAAMMLLELSGVGAQINMDALPEPEGVSERFFDWLISFPSYGFVLSVRPWRVSDVQLAFEKHGINCSSIGTVTANCNVTLVRKDEEALLWDFDKKPFTGFSSSLEDVHTHGFHEELLN